MSTMMSDEQVRAAIQAANRAALVGHEGGHEAAARRADGRDIGALDPAARLRAAKELGILDAMAQAAGQDGFFLEPCVYQVGSVVDRTADGYRRVREDFARLPTVMAAVEQVSRHVQAQERQDIRVKARDLRLVEHDGRLALQGPFPETLLMERRGFSGLAGYMDARGAAGFLGSVPLDLAVTAGNRLLRDARDTIQLRTAKRHASEAVSARTVFATVSESYTAHDEDRVARVIGRAFHGDPQARAHVELDERGARFSVQFFREHRSPCTGDVFQVGVEVQTAGDGTSAEHWRFTARRNNCLNYIVIGEGSLKLGSLRHNDRLIRGKSATLAGKAKALADVFIARWAEAERDMILDDGGDPQDVFSKLVARGAVKVPGIKPEDLTGRLLAAWQREPGRSRAHILNAITRAAHSNPWASRWATTDLEHQAGQLLYVKVLG